MAYGRDWRRITMAAATGLLLAATTACGPLADIGEGVEKRSFTIAFAGDVHFEGVLRTRLEANSRTVFGPIAQQLQRADLAMVNLETAVTTRGTPAPKQFVFRAPPYAFNALRAAGVDVVTMANNHGMDYGTDAVPDALAAAKQAGVSVVGIGATADAAFRPYVTTVNNTKVEIIGATQVLDDELAAAWTATDTKPGLASAKDVPRLLEAVRRARKEADIVVVNLHWGQELVECPTAAQRQLATELIDAGVDAVVGSHAHVLLAGGYLKNAYVDYGLGNFLFYNARDKTARSGVLTLIFDPAHRPSKVKAAEWAPAELRDGVARPLTDRAAQQAGASWGELRRCAGLAAARTN